MAVLTIIMGIFMLALPEASPAVEASPAAEPAQSPSPKPVFVLGGHIHAGYQAVADVVDPDNPDNQFAVNVARLKTTFTPTGWLKGFLHMDFVKGNPLLDAFVDLQVAPWLTIRAGQYKKPFANVRLIGFGKLKTFNRGMLDEIIANTLRFGDRDMGLLAFGKLPGQLSYSLGLFNGAGRNPENDPGKNGVARLQWKPSKLFSTGVNGSALIGVTKDGSPEQSTALAAGWDAQLTMSRLVAHAEVLWAQDTRGEGSDVLGAHLLLETTIPLGETFVLRPLVRGELFDSNLFDEKDLAYSVLAGLNLHVGKLVRIMLQGEWKEAQAGSLVKPSKTILLKVAFDSGKALVITK